MAISLNNVYVKFWKMISSEFLERLEKYYVKLFGAWDVSNNLLMSIRFHYLFNYKLNEHVTVEN